MGLTSAWVFALGLVFSLQSEGGAVLDELEDLHLDQEQIYRIRGLTVRRDVLSVAFDRGVIAFLEPVEGRVTGAVFVGSGDVVAIPSDSSERGQLYKFTGSPILNEPFNAAILRFTDDTFEEIVELARQGAFEEVRADDLEALLPWEENLGERSYLLNYRILSDLLGDASRPLFFAGVRGDRLGWFSVTYDPRNAEEVSIGSVSSDANSGLVQTRPDLWASFNRRAEARDPERFAHEDPSDTDLLAYEIDTTIDSNAELASTARARIRMLRSGERVLHFGLAQRLRLSEVTVDGVPVWFSQYPMIRESERPDPRLDRFVAVLPRVFREGEELTIEFRYAGRVLESRGAGIYYLTDRSRWYPNVGFQDPAEYELTFHYPARNTLVATGNKVSEREEGGQRHSSWMSDREFFVAGFNYGDFSLVQDETGDIPIYIYANNDVEEVYRAIEDWNALRVEQAWRLIRPPVRSGQRSAAVDVEPDYELFATPRLAQRVLDQTRSALDFFTERFGSYPFQRLSVSQVPSDQSQGWPTLLYASTHIFFDRDQLERLGFSDLGDFVQPEFQRTHEIAHQWFGNKVGWQSYRDQWLIEGLSNYASLMYLEQKYGSVEPRQAILRDLRLRLLAETSDGSRTQNDNGPIWLGERLATAEVPNGYQETVYTKATWVVHMLRMLMRDQESGSDARFLEMIQAFLKEFDGRLASSWDFMRVAERYMNERMDVKQNGSLDWFFDQWVFDTGVPRFELSYTTESAGNRFIASGRITETDDWAGVVPVPLYAIMEDGAPEFLGDVIVDRSGGGFRFTLDRRPTRIAVDPYESVLKRETR